MSRRPDGPSAREVLVAFRLSEQERDELDAKRGSLSRSDFLRERIHTARARKDTPSAESPHHGADEDRRRD